MNDIVEMNTLQMREAIEAMIKNGMGDFANEYYRNQKFSDYEIRQMVIRTAIKNGANDGRR